MVVSRWRTGQFVQGRSCRHPLPAKSLRKQSDHSWTYTKLFQRICEVLVMLWREKWNIESMQSLYRLHNCNFSFFYFTGTNAITVTMKTNKSKESSTTAVVVIQMNFKDQIPWIECNIREARVSNKGHAITLVFYLVASIRNWRPILDPMSVNLDKRPILNTF
jgi:hypothetical protein